MTKVRNDENGLYLIAGGVKARPGAINGYSHAYRMDDGGLIQGDTVKAAHVGGSQLVRIKLADGCITRWFQDGPDRDRMLGDPPKDAVWDKDGCRDFAGQIRRQET